MPDLTKLDRTQQRERAYPSIMGQAMGAYGSAWIEQANISLDKSLMRTIDMLGRPNVKIAERVGLMDGTDLTLGISLPAALMTDLRPRGPVSGKIKGGMRVREANRASENDHVGEKWNLQGGIGTALWHVDTSLTVDHSHDSKQSRDTDYSSYIDWEAEYGVYELPEGVAICSDALHEMVRAGVAVNKALAQRKIEALLADEDKVAQVAPKKDEMPEDGPTAVQADKGDDDPGTGDQESGEDEGGEGDGGEDQGGDEGGEDDAQEPEEETGDGN